MDQPQLTELVKQAPEGRDWLREIKFDGYRMQHRQLRSAQHHQAVLGANG